jgi:hypothetical protein
MKLSPEERRRVILHNRVAPPIPVHRQVKSLMGQLAFDFDRLSVASRSPVSHQTASNDVRYENAEVRGPFVPSPSADE